MAHVDRLQASLEDSWNREVLDKFNNYSASYGTQAGEGIVDRSRTSELVDTFYNLVTDIYEWGWGQSFHFSPKLPGKDWKASEAAHESRLVGALRLEPGLKCLDVGCGVGGPMRTIASVSGAHVTGLTINQYQVDRCTHHNAKMGVSAIAKAVQGDFLNMPFEKETFDAAYAIEATCHASKLEDVFGEVYRVLKPGGFFASYEWVSTKNYNPSNPEHVRIMDEINFGNGLPEMRTYIEAENAGKHVGFELVQSVDIAANSPKVCGSWYDRLKLAGWQIAFNTVLVSIFSTLRLCPKGVEDVHTMLVKVAGSLVEGGETSTFTPMHLLVFRKPDTNGKAKSAAKAGDKAAASK
ncbi:hypothetical protein WJX72_008953 [[Myrmecia] bisecta]|uniref:Methyltransferase n=1 Tax=[Myrmecia] bisecta TaxID=41462 RepID=A0AAW1QS24_9CHLO